MPDTFNDAFFSDAPLEKYEEWRARILAERALMQADGRKLRYFCPGDEPVTEYYLGPPLNWED